MEQIKAEFQEFKNNVRSTIYDLLAWEITINFGVTSYSVRITALVDFVWSLVDSVAFRAVERIIDWFNTEKLKDRIAKILLEDEELQRNMNFNNPAAYEGQTEEYDEYDPDAGLNYFAVAKLGILVFADYIHKTFIGNNDWAKDTWNWVMNNISKGGSTLVEIVNDALSFIGSGLSSSIKTIKTIAEAVGIKALNSIAQSGFFLSHTLVLPVAYRIY